MFSARGSSVWGSGPYPRENLLVRIRFCGGWTDFLHRRRPLHIVLRFIPRYVHLIEKLNQIERGGSDEKLPFTCHFNGCKFCHGHGDPGSERVCFGNFDRFYQ